MSVPWWLCFSSCQFEWQVHHLLTKYHFKWFQGFQKYIQAKLDLRNQFFLFLNRSNVWLKNNVCNHKPFCFTRKIWFLLDFQLPQKETALNTLVYLLWLFQKNSWGYLFSSKIPKYSQLILFSDNMTTGIVRLNSCLHASEYIQ